MKEEEHSTTIVNATVEEQKFVRTIAAFFHCNILWMEFEFGSYPFRCCNWIHSLVCNTIHDTVPVCGEMSVCFVLLLLHTRVNGGGKIVTHIFEVSYGTNKICLADTMREHLRVDMSHTMYIFYIRESSVQYSISMH